MKQINQKARKGIVFLVIIVFFCCGCANGKGAWPQQLPVTLYANSNYAVQIKDDSIRYLYQSGYDFGAGEDRYPSYEGYTVSGIVEGERFEEALEIISDSGVLVRDEKTMPKGWQDGHSYEITPYILNEVERWDNIVQLVGGMREGYAALKGDGTVVSIGIVNSVWEQEAVVEDWTDIVQIVAAYGYIYGLKRDGTVCVHVQGDYLSKINLEKRLAGWTDIVQITGGRELFALKEDGTVLATANDFYSYKQWEKIVAIAASRYALVGIREDGTLVAECMDQSGFKEGELSGWDEVEQIAVCDDYCIAVRKDGRVCKTGSGE